jgi:hypothetical protein
MFAHFRHRLSTNIIIIIILTANGFLPGDSGNVIRHNTENKAIVILLCVWILFIFPFLFKTNNVSETGFCLHLQVEPT